MSNLDRWVCFAAFAETLSVNRAAQRLRVDNRWLAGQIRQLEYQVGFDLISRRGSEPSLTREGRALLPRVRELAEVTRLAREEMHMLNRRAGHKVVLGYNPYLYWLPALHALVTRFRAEWGADSLDVVTNYTPRLLSRLGQLALDFALIPLPRSPLPGFEDLVIYRATTSVLAPAADPLAGKRGLTLEDSAGRTIITADPKLNPGLHKRMLEAFLAAGAIAVISPGGQAALAYHARREGHLIVTAAWPHNRFGMPEGFAPLDLVSARPSIDYALVRRHGELTPLAEGFWEMALAWSAAAT